MLKFDYILLLFCSCHRKTAAIARVSTLKRLEEDEVDGIIARLWALTVLFLSKGGGYSDMVFLFAAVAAADHGCYWGRDMCLVGIEPRALPNYGIAGCAESIEG